MMSSPNVFRALWLFTSLCLLCHAEESLPSCASQTSAEQPLSDDSNFGETVSLLQLGTILESSKRIQSLAIDKAKTDISAGRINKTQAKWYTCDQYTTCNTIMTPQECDYQDDGGNDCCKWNYAKQGTSSIQGLCEASKQGALTCDQVQPCNAAWRKSWCVGMNNYPGVIDSQGNACCNWNEDEGKCEAKEACSDVGCYVGCYKNEGSDRIGMGFVHDKTAAECRDLVLSGHKAYFGLECPQCRGNIPGLTFCLPLATMPSMTKTSDSECEVDVTADGVRLGGGGRLAVYKAPTSAPSPPPQASLSSKYVGCYKNEGSNRMNGHVANQNPAQCRGRAVYGNKAYFGLECPQCNGNNPDLAQCLPLATLPSMTKTDDSECQVDVTPDGYRLGGWNRLAVYEAPVTTTKPPTPCDDFSTMGDCPERCLWIEEFGCKDPNGTVGLGM